MNKWESTAARPADPPYDAILFLSFGGPEKREDVIPFLENVLRGKPVPRERMLEVAEHYYHFDGKSPINDQNLAIIESLRKELDRHGVGLPIYFGNRNWHPLLTDTMQQMKADGVQRALTFITSTFSSYSGCRQYRENLYAAQQAAGEGCPEVDKIRVFYNHPGFISAQSDLVREALERIEETRRSETLLLFTAHSIPVSMANTSNYSKQIEESCRLVSEQLGHPQWKLVWQSRSGPPSQPWLEPDVLDYMKDRWQSGQHGPVVIVPIGFLTDHMEVLFDLDEEAREYAEEVGMELQRASTVGTHPRFIEMIRLLIEERMHADPEKLAIGRFQASHDVCPANCCKPPLRPGMVQKPAAAQQERAATQTPPAMELARTD
jgi:ferrochelatase